MSNVNIMDKTDYIISEKFIPASVFFASNGNYYYGAEDDDKGGIDWSEKIDADTITAALETAQGLAGLFKKRELSEVEGVCGKQPKFLASRTRKQAWAQCSSDYIRSKIEASKPKREKGLSTGEWIAIGIGSAALIATVIGLIIKTKKPAMVVQAPMPAPAKVIKR